jgi:hypothetical protein
MIQTTIRCNWPYPLDPSALVITNQIFDNVKKRGNPKIRLISQKHPMLPKSQVMKLRALREKGMSYRGIGAKVGMSMCLVRDAVLGVKAYQGV